MSGTINLKLGSNTAEPVAYPCATANLETLIGETLTDVTVTSFNLTAPPGYTGGDLTAYKILIGDNAAVQSYFADLLTEGSQKTKQPVYFETTADWQTNFEQITLTAKPDDWGTTNPQQWKYYYNHNGNADYKSLYPNNQPFTAGTYYKNETMSRYFYTDNDGFIGMNLQIEFDYNNGRYTPMFDLGDWWCYWWGNMPTQAPDWKTRMPGMSGTVVWPLSGGDAWNFYVTSSTGGTLPYTPNPQNLPECWVQMVTGEYQGVTYIGVMCYFLTPEKLFDRGCLFLIPQWFWGDITPTPSGGYWGPPSTSGGGSGTYTDTNDTPGMPSSPPNFYSSIASGNYGLHVYRVSNMASWDSFQSLLWGVASANGSDLWARWQNYKFNPIAGVIGAHFLPSQLLPTTSSTAPIRLAGVVLPLATAGDLSAKQFSDFDCGTLQIPEYFGTAMDYSPYTKMRLYLPFCGVLDVDADRCIGGEINVKYRCDVITGNVCAYVFLTDRTGTCTAMLHATGNAAVSIPITGNDNGTGQILGALGSVVMGAATGNALGVLGGVSNALTAQHHMQQTGSVSGSVAAITPLDVRLEIVRPCVSTPENGTDLRGRPADISVTISDLVGTGYAEFEDVHPDIVGATDAECAEIEKLLLGGVIL